MTAHGGGLATVFNNCFKCRSVPTGVYSIFEVQLLKTHATIPMLCALVYRPPKTNSNFIQKLSDLLSFMVSHSDKLLILGDFNIHVCCPSKPMVNEFLELRLF